jgi:hypothetical protein
MPQAVGTYKTPGVKGMGRWLTVTVLPDSNRGRNARGTAAVKRGWGGSAPKGAKAPQKRQDGARMGRSPELRASPMGRFV